MVADNEALVSLVNAIAHDASGDCAEINDGCAMGQWDVSAVTEMGALFSSRSMFNQDISAWDVSNVIDHRSCSETAVRSTKT